METQDYISFAHGYNYQLYKHLGAIKATEGGYIFRVWAPNAKNVCIAGDFNNWYPQSIFTFDKHSGIWTTTVNNVKINDLYKYVITDNKGNSVYKSDPCALYNQYDSEKSSIIYDISGFNWTDESYLNSRGSDYYSKPINIYEIHLGSWKRNADNSYYTYVQLADELIPYVKEMGYTHIELMPITEYPFDGSWGYQVTGYYAPTSRYGTPHELMYFVNKCHENNIGVILDWVPAHFPKDSNGLYMFDGTPTYEYGDLLKQQHKDWGTMVFDYGKPQVVSFLISSAVLFLSEYHFDGIRVDAVASMLYLDYGRQEYRPNKSGGRHNDEAISFLRNLAYAVNKHAPNSLLIAEESTSFPFVTASAENSGLGFNLKWNMGWMNDTLNYINSDCIYRQFKHNNLTFPLVYAFSEKYILPFSHDEVVHCKKSMLDKMPGDYNAKFSGLRAFIGFQMTSPGKKLNFMGNEIAQFTEWDFAKQLDWMLLDYDRHRQMQTFVKTLNKLYSASPALYENDNGWNGFEWLVVDRNTDNLIAYIRKSQTQKYIVVCNFSPNSYTNYLIAPKGNYKLILNSDDEKFGGKGVSVTTSINSNELYTNVPPLSVLIFKTE